MNGAGRQVLVYPDARQVAWLVARRVCALLAPPRDVTRPFHLALSGGTMGAAILHFMGPSSTKMGVDWRGVHLWWSDERFLPLGAPDRNDTQARAILLRHLAPGPVIHHAPGPSDQTPDAAAAAGLYGAEVLEVVPSAYGWPTFDLILLGMGPDGHVASIFPGSPLAQANTAVGAPEAGDLVAGVHGAPKPPPDRVTFTIPLINAAERVYLAATGTAKAQAAKLALDDADIPAALVHAQRETLFYLDAAAAPEL